ncbi:MAG: hypothetical protein ACTSYI_05015, partial [Promethearchaeota archaeon]
NKGAKTISAKIFLGVEPKNKKECVQADLGKIGSGEVGHHAYFVRIKKNKHKQAGVHHVSGFLEFKNAAGLMGKAARSLMKSAVGFSVGGKLKGTHVNFKVSQTIDCPSCKNKMTFGRHENNYPYWRCGPCKTIYEK